MFVYSVKGSTLTFIGVMLLSVTVLVLLVIFVPAYDGASLPTGQEYSFSGVRTAEDRESFLSQFGWEVEAEPVIAQRVTIPADFDSVFLRYNDLQKEQGLDLSRYKRKEVEHYRYLVTNYGGEETVYANLLVYRGKVVGGDISSANLGGFVQGFRKNAGESA
jgi:hypothetical protein